MTTGTTLLRGPEDPQRATFLDLFLDLVFVFALFRLSQGLLEHMNWSAGYQTVVLLLAVWAVWTETAGVSDRFDPRRSAIQLLVIGSMFGSFVLAAVEPDAFGKYGLVFAGAYVAVQAGRRFFLVIVVRGDERQRREMRVLFWFGVSAMPWIAGGVAHDWARGLLWALALAVDYVALRLGWPTPRLGRTRAAEFGVSGGLPVPRDRGPRARRRVADDDPRAGTAGRPRRHRSPCRHRRRRRGTCPASASGATIAASRQTTVTQRATRHGRLECCTESSEPARRSRQSACCPVSGPA